MDSSMAESRRLLLLEQRLTAPLSDASLEHPFDGGEAVCALALYTARLTRHTALRLTRQPFADQAARPQSASKRPRVEGSTYAPDTSPAHEVLLPRRQLRVVSLRDRP